MALFSVSPSVVEAVVDRGYLAEADSFLSRCGKAIIEQFYRKVSRLSQRDVELLTAGFAANLQLPQFEASEEEAALFLELAGDESQLPHLLGRLDLQKVRVYLACALAEADGFPLLRRSRERKEKWLTSMGAAYPLSLIVSAWFLEGGLEGLPPPGGPAFLKVASALLYALAEETLKAVRLEDEVSDVSLKPLARRLDERRRHRLNYFFTQRAAMAIREYQRARHDKAYKLSSFKANVYLGIAEGVMGALFETAPVLVPDTRTLNKLQFGITHFDQALLALEELRRLAGSRGRGGGWTATPTIQNPSLFLTLLRGQLRMELTRLGDELLKRFRDEGKAVKEIYYSPQQIEVAVEEEMGGKRQMTPLAFDVSGVVGEGLLEKVLERFYFDQARTFVKQFYWTSRQLPETFATRKVFLGMARRVEGEVDRLFRALSEKAGDRVYRERLQKLAAEAEALL